MNSKKLKIYSKEVPFLLYSQTVSLLTLKDSGELEGSTVQGSTFGFWRCIVSQSLSRFLLSVSVLAFLFAFSGANAAQPLFLRGDSNSDTRVDIGDPVFSLIFIFREGQAPACMDAVDANDDGQIDISDPVYTLLFLFQGGRSPPPPFPAPGVDPTADNVTCGQTNPSGFGTLLVAIHDTP